MINLLDCLSRDLEKLSVNDQSVVSARSVSANAYWLLKDIELEQKYVHVRLKVQPDMDDADAYYYCKLYFLEKGHEAFDEAHSLTIPINRLGEFDDYNFKCLVFQQKKIVALRLHPFSHRGCVEIEGFDIRPYAQKPRPDVAKLAGRINPLLLSFFSRSGSTLVMKMLVRHPEITGYTRGTHEAHFIRYFSRLYYMIKTSHIYSGDHSDGTLLRRLEVLSQHYKADSVLPKPMEFPQYMDLGIFRSYYLKFLTDYLPEMLADMEVPGLYSAKFYAEKHMDGMPFELTQSMLELFSELKVVMLFRDPRDVLLSFDAYRRLGQINEFREDRASRVKEIMRHYRGRINLLDESPERIFPLRYEDVILRPNEVVPPLLEFLCIDASERSLQMMMEPISRGDLQSRMHITSESKNASIGRWRNELSVEEQELFVAHADVLEHLGYADIA